jgi:serine/threonine protein phosphatase PrpC
MEDAILFKRINKEIFLFAVFDGHGGVEVSQFCAEHFPAVLEGNDAFQRGEYELALEQTFKAMDDLLGSEHGEEKLKSISAEKGMQPFENSKVAESVGCTANVALMVGKRLYVANAGDSRAALSRGGSIIELSFDHKPENPL